MVIEGNDNGRIWWYDEAQGMHTTSKYSVPTNPILMTIQEGVRKAMLSVERLTGQFPREYFSHNWATVTSSLLRI